MKVLFICRHNVFRSKVAEAYFKKINKNKKIIAESSGIFPESIFNKFQKKTAKEFGIEIKGIPRGTNLSLLKKQDLVIIVANDVPKKLFNYTFLRNKVKVWKIPDVTTGDDIKGNKKAIELIIKEVNNLVRKLK